MPHGDTSHLSEIFPGFTSIQVLIPFAPFFRLGYPGRCIDTGVKQSLAQKILIHQHLNHFKHCRMCIGFKLKKTLLSARSNFTQKENFISSNWCIIRMRPQRNQFDTHGQQWNV